MARNRRATTRKQRKQRKRTRKQRGGQGPGICFPHGCPNDEKGYHHWGNWIFRGTSPEGIKSWIHYCERCNCHVLKNQPPMGMILPTPRHVPGYYPNGSLV